MRRLAVLGLVLGACTAQFQTEDFLEGRFDVPDPLVSGEVAADSMRYLLWFPAGYVVGDDVPVVVFLHGSGDDDYDSRWLTSYGLPAVLEFENIPVEPFVLLAPQAMPGTSWDMGNQPETVMALVDDVVDRYDLDPAAVSLTGLSMGGYGAWHLATRFPGRFHAVASLSGSGYGSTVLPDGEDVCVLADVDLRAYHGANDMVSLPELNVAVIDEWEDRCGAEIDLRMFDDTGHFETFERVYRDPAFYDWLLP
ncbi:MAG: alpha/beta hydrolase-fold protein [Acidimicrobiia bacterium]